MRTLSGLLAALCLLGTSTTRADTTEAVPEPAPGTCAVVGRLSPWRYSPSLTLLPNGEVLIAGGRQSDDSRFMTAVHLFTPGTRKIRPAAPMGHARSLHGAVLTSDGKVLVVGGRTTKAVELYDPVTNRWKKVGAIQDEVVEPIVETLPSGNVLIAGGDLMWKDALASAAFEWRPRTGKLVPLAPLPEGRSGESVVRLPDGRIEIGVPPAAAKYRGVEGPEFLYDEKTGWTEAKVKDPVIRAHQTSDVDGTLVRPARPGGAVVRFTEKALQAFDPKSGAWREVARLDQEAPGATAVMLDEDTALIAGGLDEESSRVVLCTLATGGSK